MAAPLRSEQAIFEYRQQTLVRLLVYAFRIFLFIVCIRSLMLITAGANAVGFFDLANFAHGAMWCRISLMMARRGRFQRALNTFLLAYVFTVAITIQYLETLILLNTMGLLMLFNVITLVLEVPHRSLRWGLATIGVWFVSLLLRVQHTPFNVPPDQYMPNFAAPMMILAAITWMLQLSTRHLYATIRASEEARAEVERGHMQLAEANAKLERANEQMKVANARLVEAREVAEAANRSKSQFLANMSHELRTPLNAIIGYSEMLSEEIEDDQNLKDLKKVHASGQHLLTLINDILDISKIESGKMELYLEEFEITELIDDTLATAEPLISKNKNKLVIDVPANIGTMRADVTKVRQALLNLLSNAAKFTIEGAITLRARRDSNDGGDWVVMSVKDTGIGMTQEQQTKIFEPFSQVDASTTRKFGGTGLGLAITRSFCEMMGGTISGTSAKDVGSTFTIRLPVVVRDPSDADASDDSPDEGDPKPGDFKVLVIDNDAPTRHLMRQHFAREGWYVATSKSSTLGLKRANELIPDVITIDVQLGEGDDGWALLRLLRESEKVSRVPVIVVTIDDQKKRIYQEGAADYVRKPFERGQLVKTVRKYRRTPSAVVNS